MKNIIYLRGYSGILLIYLLSFVIQFIKFDIGLSHIKLFMITTVVFYLYLFRKIEFRLLFDYEFLWLLSYFWILISSLYAPDKLLALQILIGQVILVSSFFLLRFLINKLKLLEFEKIFLFVGKSFIYVSIVLYVLGILMYYVFNWTPLQSSYLNDHSIRIFGLYLEGSVPRLMGLSESPNNYSYFAMLFMWFFVYKRHLNLAIITFFTLLLTISSTCIFALIIHFFLLFFFVSRMNKFKMIFLLFIVATVFYYLYIKFPFVKEVVDYRIERNSTGSGRLGLWKYVYSLLIESPFFGYGANQSRLLIAPYRGLMSTHNSFLEILLTTGILGGITYLSFLFILFRKSYLMSCKVKTPMFLALTISFILFGTANNTLHIEYVIFYLGFIYYYHKKIFKHLSNKI